MIKVGVTEVICGSMYCGKTEELIRRLKRVKIANKKYQLFKPKIDNRYSESEVVTHAGESLKAQIVEDSEHLLSLIEEDTEVVGIDEVQFFDNSIIDVIEKLNKRGIRVIAAGLDMYSDGTPFGPMPILMAKAKYVDKLHAVCVDCGDEAYISYAINNNKSLNTKSTVKVGSVGDYIALCEKCRERRILNERQNSC